MELTQAQLKNLVNAKRAYLAAKKQHEATAANVAQKLDKLKETAQATGQEAQVMAAADVLLANAYLALPEPLEG